MVLAGCLSVPAHDLSVSDLARYRIVDVTVEGAEVIRSWPGEEQILLKTGAVDPETARRMETEPASNFPQVTAHFRQALEGKMKAELGYLTGSVFTGTQPAVVVVRLKTFDIPSTARRVFVDNQAKIQADIDVVEKATGRLILRYNGPFETRKLVGGLVTGIALAFEKADIGYSMITDYLSAYRNWLLRN